MLTAPPGRDGVSGRRYAGGRTGALPRTRRRSIRDSRDRSSPSRSQGNHLGRAAWFMHPRRRAGQSPSVTRSGSSRFVGGARTGPRGDYCTGGSSGRGDKGPGRPVAGGRSRPGATRIYDLPVLRTCLNNGKDATTKATEPRMCTPTGIRGHSGARTRRRVPAAAQPTAPWAGRCSTTVSEEGMNTLS